jgi:hypothetical protein
MNSLPASLNGLLTPAQMEEIGPLGKELAEAWDTQTIWRTWTEANFSVLNDLKFPTAASKYHQAKKEQLVFWENLVALSFDYRDALIDLAETESKIESDANEFELRRLHVKRDRLLFSIEGMKLQARERIREIKMWSDIKASLDDGSFDTTDKDTDELIGLTIRYCRELPAAQRTKDAGAAINIVGQAATMLKECERRGIVGQLGSDGQKAKKMLR